MMFSTWLFLLPACGPDSIKPIDSANPAPPDTDSAIQCGGSEEFQEDWRTLTEGVGRIPLDGAYPSRIVAFGERAFPVVLDNAGHSIIAAARYGEGHVLHVGHESLIGGALPNARGVRGLLRNTLAWMGTESPRVGIEPGQEALAAYLRDEGLPPVETSPAELQDIDIYIRGSSGELSPEETTQILEHVNAGGGLISGGHAWYWGYSNENAVENHPGNQVLVPMGLALTTAYSEADTHVLPDEPPSSLSHPSSALQAIIEHVSETTMLDEADLVTASTAVRLAVAELPLSVGNYTDCLKTYLANVEPVEPTPERPLLPQEQPIDSLTATIDHKFMQELPANEVTAHPGHMDFPGAIDDTANPVTVEFEVNASYGGRAAEYIYSNAASPRWESTGLYVAAGEPILVESPATSVGTGIDLLVGSHTDTLWHLEAIERLPAITRAWPIEATTLDVASATGGLLYVRIPAGTDLGTLSFRVEGAYEAPMYVHHTTSLDDWQNMERQHQAPWAELVTDKLVLTVPTDAIRELDDPFALMEFWEAVQDANATLEGVSTDRDRAERIVLDRQISAGWLHSGYPIMGYNSIASDLTDLAHLQTEGDWGPFHELGHNYQWSHWVLPGTTETTCNLFSVYVMEEVVGIDMGSGHSAVSDAERQTRLQNYLDNGADFDNEWSVWTALETYLQLQEGFGWEFYTSLFTTYRDEAIEAHSDAERIATWIRQSSAASNRNLAPFYKAWGFPVSTSLESELSAYPPWDEDPMAP